MATAAAVLAPPRIRAEDHLGLVRRVARQYVRDGEPIDDSEAFADGVIGLMEAIETYTFRRAAFSTHAVHCISNAIITGHRKRNQKKRSLPEQRIHRAPHQNFKKTRRSSQPKVDVFEFLEPSKSDSEPVQNGKRVLYLQYACGKSLREIGREMGISRQSAWNLASLALDVIRAQHRLTLWELEEECLG